eukprot:gene15249-6455_t
MEFQSPQKKSKIDDQKGESAGDNLTERSEVDLNSAESENENLLESAQPLSQLQNEDRYESDNSHIAGMLGEILDDYEKGSAIRMKIIDEIKLFGIFAVIADTTPDSSQVDQISFIIRTNLCVEQACRASMMIDQFFATLQQLFNFFTRSIDRFGRLKDRIEELKEGLVMKNSSKTRWIGRAETIRAVWIGYEILIDTFKDIECSKECDREAHIEMIGKWLAESNAKILLEAAQWVKEKGKVYPSLLKAYQLALTIPVSVTSNERSFSKLRHISGRP